MDSNDSVPGSSENHYGRKASVNKKHTSYSPGSRAQKSPKDKTSVHRYTPQMPPLLFQVVLVGSIKTTQSREIIGGHEAKPHSRPYMAFIEFLYTTFRKPCGGFLIHEKFVLTAAHCFKRNPESQIIEILVVLGAHNITKQEKTQQYIRVQKCIPHPQFNLETLTNDIMLLQLKGKAMLTEAVQILQLPSRKSQVLPGTMCQVAGWGMMDQNKKLASTLQEVEMTVQDDKECEIRYPNYNSATQMCAGDPKIQKTSFLCDSGGPFLCNNVVHAIDCSGSSDGKPPSIYTKLSPYLDWIEKTIKHLLL
ncbi:granzyme B(G,H)-like [Octodon degus]|uniref:Granzyme B(G,H)-like n=1 Tax=Octodon degus TaxID=10160 RepID=A0A6P3FWJ7_OCTDE|nr:granzyme B(G,H)-like [Octodon degus]